LSIDLRARGLTHGTGTCPRCLTAADIARHTKEFTVQMMLGMTKSAKCSNSCWACLTMPATAIWSVPPCERAQTNTRETLARQQQNCSAALWNITMQRFKHVEAIEPLLPVGLALIRRAFGCHSYQPAFGLWQRILQFLEINADNMWGSVTGKTNSCLCVQNANRGGATRWQSRSSACRRSRHF
jgi:hypothetical protein